MTCGTRHAADASALRRRANAMKNLPATLGISHLAHRLDRRIDPRHQPVEIVSIPAGARDGFSRVPKLEGVITADLPRSTGTHRCSARTPYRAHQPQAGCKTDCRDRREEAGHGEPEQKSSPG